LIFHAFIGYPISLFVLGLFIKNKNSIDPSLQPSVSVIIPAHNEDSVIEKKLENLIQLNYRRELLEIIIASDNSTDNTNSIVSAFIQKHPEFKISLYKVMNRKGKTNAQNEAVEKATGEIIVFSDANAILDKDAVINLASSFTSDDIVYVAGRLKYVNSLENPTSSAESAYWNYDLFMRKAESDIHSITAGNGAIYAIRKKDYFNFDPIYCHDSVMPIHAALRNKKAVYNPMALAFEKAGETTEDEFKRKVRMARYILTSIFGNMSIYNPFKTGWFSYFYFSHRALRYSLFILHFSAFMTNALLFSVNRFYALLFALQFLFYLLAFLKYLFNSKNKIVFYPYYYTISLLAQLKGAINQIQGKSKPFWEKAESTR